jgi:hypothetical protein
LTSGVVAVIVAAMGFIGFVIALAVAGALVYLVRVLIQEVKELNGHMREVLLGPAVQPVLPPQPPREYQAWPPQQQVEAPNDAALWGRQS